MEGYKLKDYILNALLTKDVSVMEFEKTISITPEQLDVALDSLELEHKFIKMIYEDGGGTYTLKSKGRDFIENNSFEQLQIQKQEEENRLIKDQLVRDERTELEFKWKKKDEKRKNTALIFGLIAAALGLWNGYNQITNTGSMNKITARIDSINAIVYLSRLKIDSLSNITNVNKTKKAADDAIKKVKIPAPTSIIK